MEDTMIATKYTEAFSNEWIDYNIRDKSHYLFILCSIIPWNEIIQKLQHFFNQTQGRFCKSLRTMSALLIVSKLEDQLSDRKLVRKVKENRYIQFFCNVSDEKLGTFLDKNGTTICKFRKRIGEKGTSIIENLVFKKLRQAGVIENDTALIDSTVLNNNIIYPNDVLLLNKAFHKMFLFAKNHNIKVWWDNKNVKKIWREFNTSKQKNRKNFLIEFEKIFTPALMIFGQMIYLDNKLDFVEKEEGRPLLELLQLLEKQTKQKIAGETHIEERIVSLDEIDARPIKKGKAHPKCEFGTTLELSFNRAGFMITAENLKGNPNDKILYSKTLDLYIERLRGYPEAVVTDLGYRSKNNLNKDSDKIHNIFLGKSSDVYNENLEYCKKSRSATEGFIAVAKNLYGFGKSLYRGIIGDIIWTKLCQIGYNLKKFIRLYQQEKISEYSLKKLDLLG